MLFATVAHRIYYYCNPKSPIVSLSSDENSISWVLQWDIVYRPEKFHILTFPKCPNENLLISRNFIFQEHQVKDGLAINFFLNVLVTIKAEKGGAAVLATVKKSGLDDKLINFFPATNQQQTDENFAKVFNEKNLGEVVQFRKQHAFAEHKSGILKMIKESVNEKRSPKEIIIELKDECVKHDIAEQDTVVMVSQTLLFSRKSSKTHLMKKDEIFCR